jgi:DamX protein
MPSKLTFALILSTSLLTACSNPFSTKPTPDPAPVNTPPVTNVPSQPTTPPPSTPSYSADAQVLMSQAPHTYTLQVMGAQNASNITTFKNRYPGYRFYQIQSSLNGQPWHVLFYGIFNSKTEAENAKRSLPPAVQQNKPFPKSMAEVQAQISRGSVR